MRTALALVIAALASPAFAKPPPKKPAPAKAIVLTAKQDRIKKMHDFDVKWAIGLPIVAHKGSASEVKNKWTEPFDVSPPILEWVTDYGEAEGSTSRIQLSKIHWPDGS